MPFVLDRNHVLDTYPDAAANMPGSPFGNLRAIVHQDHVQHDTDSVFSRVSSDFIKCYEV